MKSNQIFLGIDIMHHRQWRQYLPAVLIMVSMSALATTPPPAAPSMKPNVHATLRQTPAAGLGMGSFAIEFEKTTLEEVRRAASLGEIAHAGDAGESTYWLCYTRIRPTQIERIWVIANAEMGGPDHRVTSIEAEIVPNGRATSDCPALPERLGSLRLGTGIWLGESASALVARLGQPSFEKNRWSWFGYAGKVAGRCRGPDADLSAWIWLHAEDGRIDALQAGQVTSC